uniref:Peptidase_M14 domain-containing protein n=1 Tax=Trichuris muris TaxID=70415 RepID=A0A5S6Q9V0_TRIMR
MIFICFVAVVLFTTLSALEKYEGSALLEIIPESALDQKSLQKLEHGELMVDFWKAAALPGQKSIALVRKEFKREVAKYLRKHKLKWIKLDFNVGKHIRDVHFTWLEKNKVKKIEEIYSDWKRFPYNEYNGYEEISSLLSQINAEFPNMTRLVTIGQSYEGRNLSALRIGTAKRGIWIDAGIHAREWIAVSSAVYMIGQILKDYNKGDPKVRHLMDNISWYILPMFNPDGYEFTRTTDRLWRKSRSRNNVSSINCDGVDLNRNFDVDFGVSGTSMSPCSHVYCGPHAFSEPETISLRRFLKENERNLVAYVALHTFSQLWLMPFGYGANEFPLDINELNATALEAVQALRSVHHSKYHVMTSGQLYPASGDGPDWVKTYTKIPYCYTIELRPDHYRKGGFVLPESEIIPTGEEVYAGLKAMAEHILKKLPKN